MKTLPVLLCVVTLTVPVFSAAVSGEWTINITWYRIGGTHTTVCTLQQHDRELTGSCWWAGRQYPVTGETHNGAVSWSFDIDEDSFVDV